MRTHSKVVVASRLAVVMVVVVHWIERMLGRNSLTHGWNYYMGSVKKP